MKYSFFILFLLCISCAPKVTNSVVIAAASSFRPALQAVAPLLNETCGVSIGISSAATGVLAHQMRQGAPFDLLILADPGAAHILQNTVDGIVLDGAFARSPMAYWQNPKGAADGKTAIANAEIAPFGRAAVQVIGGRKIGLVYGANAAQAFLFVQSGAARAGYVPLSLVLSANVPAQQYEIIDQDRYQPILLQSVHFGTDEQVLCLVRALKSEEIAGELQKFGYERP